MGLNQDVLKDHLMYDQDTGIFTRLISNARRVKVGDIAGSVNKKGYLMIMINYRLYQAHRLAWLYVTGDYPTGYIDHVNRGKLDNRVSNLRLATHSQNLANRGLILTIHQAIKG